MPMLDRSFRKTFLTVRVSLKHTFHRYFSLTEHKNQSLPVVWNECPIFFLRSTHRSTHTWIYRDYRRRYTRLTQCCPISFNKYTLPLHAYVLLNTVPHSPPFLQRILIARRGLSTCSYKTRHISLAISHNELVPRSFDAY